jgi:hypothetical protein
MSTTADLKRIHLSRRAQWEAGLASGLLALPRAQDRIAWQVLPPFASEPDILHRPGSAGRVQMDPCDKPLPRAKINR